MLEKDNRKMLYAFDRCIILRKSYCEDVKDVLSKRLLTNKRIDIEFKIELECESVDFVTENILSSYFELCVEDNEYTFCELMYSDFSAKVYTTHIDTVSILDKESEEYLDYNPPYTNSSLRINNSVDISQYKKENFDEKYGIVTNIYKDLMSSDISVVGCEFHHNGQLNFSYGREKNFESAERSAILELIERMAMYGVEGDIVTTSYVNSGNMNFVDPETLLFYSEEFKNRGHRFEYAREYKWLKVEEYFKKEKAWIPLQFFDMAIQNEPMFVFESSNGVALGSSIYEAKLFALFEFVERDAFLNFWYKQARLYRIDFNSVQDTVRKKIARFETENKKIYLFDMTFDVSIPSILCLAVDFKGKVATYISTASHVDYNIAINAAVNECIVGHRIYETNPRIGKKTYESDKDIVEMFDHVSHASLREYIKNYEFLFDSEIKTVDELYGSKKFRVPSEIDNAKDLLEYLCTNKLADLGPIFFADLTTTQSYRYGFYVAKIIVSGMLPMTFGYECQRINYERIQKAIENSQYSQRCLRKGDEIDDRAHPFP